MIKQIQLRGISRTPSDRMTSDGGCAESLNVHLDAEEIAPNLSPKDVTFGEFGAPSSGVDGDILYIHEGEGYKNLITREGPALYATGKTLGTTGGRQQIYSLGSGETVLEIASVGYTIILATTACLYYVRYVDGVYEQLGTEVPIPDIEFRVNLYNSSAVARTRNCLSIPGPSIEILNKLDANKLDDVEGDEFAESNSLADVIQNALDSSIIFGFWNDDDNGISTMSDERRVELLLSSSWRLAAEGGDSAAKRKLDGYRNQIFSYLGNSNTVHVDGSKQRFVNFPVMIRSAVRLYDGNYIHQSAPVYLSNGNDINIYVRAIRRILRKTSTGFWDFLPFVEQKKDKDAVTTYLNVAPDSPQYGAKAYLRGWDDISKWNDIVESVDLFLTPYIVNPSIKSEISDLELLSGEDDYRKSAIYEVKFKIHDNDTEDNLMVGTFFKIASFKVGNLSRIEEGYDVFSEKSALSNDLLMTQERLEDGYRSGQAILAKRLSTYNNRLLMTDVSFRLGGGYKYVPGPVLREDAVSESYVFRFYVKKKGVVLVANSGTVQNYQARGIIATAASASGNDYGGLNTPTTITGVSRRSTNGGVSLGTSSSTRRYSTDNLNTASQTTVRRRASGTNAESGETEYADVTVGVSTPDITITESGIMAYAACQGILFYPDADCYRVVASVTRSGVTTHWAHEMKPHPSLNCAYAFWGLEYQIGEGIGWTRINFLSAKNNDTYTDPELLLMSEPSNPFLFKSEGYVSFYSDVLNMAAVTVPLSQGQFGQYPLYVFTMSGIWALQLNSDGSFASIVFVSKDVLSSRYSLAVAEQAVIFASARGILLLSGLQVASISSEMEGAHFSAADIPGLVDVLAENSTWREFRTLDFADNTAFKQFINGCRIAYDYSSGRAIIFNPLKDEDGRSVYPYQYIYCFSTSTWHKQALSAGEGADIRPIRGLNSYPECCVVMENEKRSGRQSVYSLSQFADGTQDQVVLPGLIITRPLSLDYPDVRKSIRRVRIRGNFNRGGVKYIMLGSMDGLHWARLTSLRGGSYKWFRFVLLSNMSSVERISWIDIDYETRFANKLR